MICCIARIGNVTPVQLVYNHLGQLSLIIKMKKKEHSCKALVVNLYLELLDIIQQRTELFEMFLLTRQPFSHNRLE